MTIHFVSRLALLFALALSISIVGCESEGDLLEECGEDTTSACAQVVSCCDAIFSDDPSGATLGGESCLLDLSIAQFAVDQEDGESISCWEMHDKEVYQDLCFSCDTLPQ